MAAFKLYNPTGSEPAFLESDDWGTVENAFAFVTQPTWTDVTVERTEDGKLVRCWQSGTGAGQFHVQETFPDNPGEPTNFSDAYAAKHNLGVRMQSEP